MSRKDAKGFKKMMESLAKAFLIGLAGFVVAVVFAWAVIKDDAREAAHPTKEQVLYKQNLAIAEQGPTTEVIWPAVSADK